MTTTELKSAPCPCCGAPLSWSDFNSEWTLPDDQYVAQCDTRNCHRHGRRTGELHLFVVTTEHRRDDDGYEEILTISETADLLAFAYEDGSIRHARQVAV